MGFLKEIRLKQTLGTFTISRQQAAVICMQLWYLKMEIQISFWKLKGMMET